MKTTVTGRHVEITSELRALILQKLKKLERILNDKTVSAQVILSPEHAPAPRRSRSTRATTTCCMVKVRARLGLGPSASGSTRSIRRPYAQGQVGDTPSSRGRGRPR